MDLDEICRRDRRIGRAMASVLRDLTARLSRDDVARTAGLEPTYFSKRFQEVTDMTFASWSRSVRVEAASQLLKTTGQRIADIAADVGYGNTTTFERAFRKVTGMCPSHYRARAARKNTSNAEKKLTDARHKQRSQRLELPTFRTWSGRGGTNGMKTVEAVQSWTLLLTGI